MAKEVPVVEGVEETALNTVLADYTGGIVPKQLKLAVRYACARRTPQSRTPPAFICAFPVLLTGA